MHHHQHNIDYCVSRVLQLQRACAAHAGCHHGHAHIQVTIHRNHDDDDNIVNIIDDNDHHHDNAVAAVLPMWGRRTRMVQCLTQCSRWSSTSSSSSSSSSISSSSSSTCAVSLLGDHHDDVCGLRRHLSNHLVWQAHRRGTSFIYSQLSNFLRDTIHIMMLWLFRHASVSSTYPCPSVCP